MIRVAFTADNQYDERHRLEEAKRVDAFMVADSLERDVDLWLHGGDVYERRSTQAEREAAFGFFTDLDAPCLVVSGNHEAPGEVDELNWLAGSDIGAYESPTVVYIAGCAVACLPWPRKANLLKWLGDRATPEHANATAQEMLRDILRGFRAQLEAHDGPRILLAHAMVRGSSKGPDQPPLVGTELELGLEDLALAAADVVLLGHVHMPQEWAPETEHAFKPGVSPVIYAGSPRRTAYANGELVEKGYVVLEFGERHPEGRMPVIWERVPTPATPMKLVETEWRPEFQTFDPATSSVGYCTDAEIRFRYTVDSDQREAARQWADVWAAGAHENGAAEVKVEEVVRAKSSARAPEIAAARGIPDKLRALWEAREIEIDQPRAERLFGLVGELQEVS